MSGQDRSARFFAGLVTGGLVGAGLALFLAPQSGEKTRIQIRDKSLELRDEAAEGLTEAGQRAQKQAAAWQEKGKKVTKRSALAKTASSNR